MASLNIADYLAIGIYLAVIVAIGLGVARRQTSTLEYFIANRRIPAFAVAFTLMATTVSSVTFVAIPGSVFARNWWQMLYMSMTLIVLLFVARYIVAFYRRVVGMSAYEYLERRFGYLARLYGALGFIVLRVADLGFTLYLTAVAVEVIVGWNISGIVIGTGLFTLAYTLVGGIEASIWTSVVQGGILIGGAVVILSVILLVPEAGPGAILSEAYQGGKFNFGNFELSWESFQHDDANAWIFMIAGLMYFGRYYVTEQNMVQRYLVARSDREAKRGVKMGILATVPAWFTFALIGSCLWSFYRLTDYGIPDQVIQQPDNILPYFIATQLPQGFVGLILAALFSSAMSSVSADLNSVATVVTQDFFVHALPQSPDRTRLLVGRLVVLTAGLISTGAGLLLTLTRSTAAYEMVALSVSIVAGGMLGLFGLGFLSRKATRQGAYVGILVCLLFVGWATATGPIGLDLGVNFTLHALMIGVLSNFVLFAVGYLASLLLGGHRPKLVGLTVWDKGAVK